MICRWFDRSPAEPYPPVGVIGSGGGSRGEPNGGGGQDLGAARGWRELVHVLFRRQRRAYVADEVFHRSWR